MLQSVLRGARMAAERCHSVTALWMTALTGPRSIMRVEALRRQQVQQGAEEITVTGAVRAVPSVTATRRPVRGATSQKTTATAISSTAAALTAEAMAAATALRRRSQEGCGTTAAMKIAAGTVGRCRAAAGIGAGGTAVSSAEASRVHALTSFTNYRTNLKIINLFVSSNKFDLVARL